MDETDNVVLLRPRSDGAADPGLRRLGIEWARNVLNRTGDQTELFRIARGIIDTQATSRRGVFYKAAAAAMTPSAISPRITPLGCSSCPLSTMRSALTDLSRPRRRSPRPT